MSIQAIIFDLDGTLLDRDASLLQFIDYQYEARNAAIGHIPKEIFTKKYVEYDAGGYVWKDEVYKRLIDEFTIDLPFDDLLIEYTQEFFRFCIPFPYMEKTLNELKKKGYKIGMITNGRTAFQNGNIDALRIRHFFDEILISEEEGIKKPDSEIFKRAAERLGVERANCIFVGDHLENDVRASIAAGMKGVWKRNKDEKHSEAEYIVDCLSEIPLFIEKKLKGSD